MHACVCLTLCDPTDCSLPGSSVHGISQVRILQQAAISPSRGSSWPWDQTHISCNGKQILLPLSHQGSIKSRTAYIISEASPGMTDGREVGGGLEGEACKDQFSYCP